MDVYVELTHIKKGSPRCFLTYSGDEVMSNDQENISTQTWKRNVRDTKNGRGISTSFRVIFYKEERRKISCLIRGFYFCI